MAGVLGLAISGRGPDVIYLMVLYLNLIIMKRVIAFSYGIISYLIFFGSFIYLIGFLGEFGTYFPQTVNSGASGSRFGALFINIGLIALFGVQHSVMARRSFKDWWSIFIPEQLERSTYVLFSSLALILLFQYWQPMPETVWQVETAWAAYLLHGGFWLGWLLVFLSTWMIDHFSLFGLRQVWNYWKEQKESASELREPGLYKYIRHPLMLGFLIAFWSRPHMTVGHFVFSAGMTLYILIGIYYEEQTMTRHFGNEYKDYQERVPKLFPRIK